MKQSAQRHVRTEAEPVRVLGRGLRAQQGVRLTIRTVREAVGKAQIDVATASHIDQADVSRLESRADFDDCQVSTLRRYVEALGGNLEVVAAFGNKRITLTGVEDGPAGERLAKPLQPTPKGRRR